MQGYFNDILAGVVLLALVNILLWLFRLPGLKKLLPCLALCLACGLFWEYVTPLYLPHSVSDIWDIAAYMSGGGVWWLLCKIKK